MKKIKKVLAMIMAMAMIMGLGMTAFAATTPQENVTATNGKIKVKNLTQEDTTVEIYKIIDFVNGEWNSVKDGYDNYIQYGKDPVVVTWADIKAYIDKEQIQPNESKTESDGEIEFENLGIGAYLVVASGATTEYNVMGSFTYGYDAEHIMVATDIEIDAKGSKYQVTKKFADGSETFVGLGDTVTYDIETVFPSFPEADNDREFWIEDQPSGLQITDIKVYVADMATPISDTNYTLTNSEGDEATLPSEGHVRINFTPDYIGMANEHATEAVKVVVTATVIETADDGTFSNKAITDNQSTPAEAEGETGSLTIRKVDGDGNLLKGAVFNVAIKGDENLSFVRVDDGVYKLALITDEDKTTDLVATDGTLVIKGLDDEIYEITEKTAPEGYQIVDVNDQVPETDRTIDEGEDKDITIDVVNTKLHSLPSTGGIGTTIFTIGGIVIMVAAAGLYFANRRKNNAE